MNIRKIFNTLFLFTNIFLLGSCNNNDDKVQVFFVNYKTELSDFNQEILQEEYMNVGDIPSFHGKEPTKQSGSEDYNLVFTGFHKHCQPVKKYDNYFYIARFDPISNNTTIYIETKSANINFNFEYDGYNMMVDWGDGNKDFLNSHTFSLAGKYKIIIHGNIYKINIKTPSLVTKIVTSYCLNDINFNQCSDIEEVVLSIGCLNEIPDNYFSGLTHLRHCNIPSNIKRIGKKAFYGCELLTIVNSLSPEIVEIDDYAFYNCRLGFDYDSVYQVTGISFSLLDKLKRIGNYAFYNCCVDDFMPNYYYTSWRQIATAFNENLLEIGEFAFTQAKTDDNIPVAFLEENTHFEENSFYKCEFRVTFNHGINKYYNEDNWCIYPKGKTNLIKGSILCKSIPNYLTSIDDYAFYCSENFITENHEIYIPKEIITVGVGIFSNCRNLKIINCETNSKPDLWSNDWLKDCNATVNWGVSK